VSSMRSRPVMSVLRIVPVLFVQKGGKKTERERVRVTRLKERERVSVTRLKEREREHENSTIP
jgi:hypothetical protein